MECFCVMRELIEGRIDPSPYHPVRLNTIKKVKSSKFNLLPLKEVAQFSKKLVTLKTDDLIYVGLQNIESNTGVFIPSEEERESFGTALKFEKGDILFPKLRPYLNKVYLAEFDGVCSTEFHVLKAKKCDKMYLFCFLNSQLVVNQTSYLMTGNTLPRLQTAEVENLLIPIPPPQIQNKIVEQRTKIRDLRKSKEAESQKLLDSINDYVLEELGIILPELKDKMAYVVSSEEVKNNRCDAYYFQPKFEDVEKAISEGKFEVKEIGKGIIVYNKLENIENYDFINYVDLSSINKNLGLIKSYDKLEIAEAPSRARQKLEKGDLLLSSLVGSLKSIAIFEGNFDNAICSTGFYVIKNSKDYNNYYLYALFRGDILQMLLQRESSGAIMSAINREALSKLKIPLPPLSVQNKIADEVKRRMQKAETLQKEAKEELEKAKLEVERIILG